MSRAERPLAANVASSEVRLDTGPGRLPFAAAWLAVRASFRPSLTGHVVPPRSATASRAASASTSAHDTVARHAASTRAFAASTTSNPRAEPAFAPAPFSPVNPGGASSSRTDPSQPFTKQSWKKSLSTDAPMRRSAATARAITDRTTDSTAGHVLA
ncbi:Os02g0236900 [Oryza sativa Japonica Group]|uniref:Os02g0236900 protein n=1 Tax=Oryza sativa subsp. japonica TaxID=39947 RepID=A0A0P0VGX1_ORYSJ|nr:hypothetical protein EE612_010017 [Oryza sativa]BAS77826.1 Os02g0236900 [Oryza sativa Japonica Group]